MCKIIAEALLDLFCNKTRISFCAFPSAEEILVQSYRQDLSHDKPMKRAAEDL